MLAAVVVTAVVYGTRLDAGSWSSVETSTLLRVMGERGEALYGLERAPAIDTSLRASTAGWLASPIAGMRLPGLLAVCVTIALVVALARRTGSTREALLAGGIALALPISSFGATMAVGRPLGEMAIGLAIVAGTVGSNRHRSNEAARWLLIASSIVIATASVGLALGTMLPAAVLAIAAASAQRRRIAIAWAVLAAIAALVTAWLTITTGSGFVPIVAAAKDTTLLSTPYARPLGTALDDASAQLFPWLPLALLGLVHAGPQRITAVWWGLGLVIAEALGHAYGSIALPLTIPTAILATRGLAALADPRRDATARRIEAVLVVIGLLVVGKGPTLVPELFGSPLAPFTASAYPAEAITTGTTLGGAAKIVALTVIVVAVVGARMTWQSTKRHLITATTTTAVLTCLWAWRVDVLPASTRHLSPGAVLITYDTRIAGHDLPTTIGRYRIDEPALPFVMPAVIKPEVLSDRAALLQWLGHDDLRTALMPKRELASVYASTRAERRDLVVLDATNPEFMVVANRRIDGLDDQNPLARIVSRTRPSLEHETDLRFGDAIEVVGWQIDGSLVRTRQVTVTLALHVLGRVPGKLQITTRLVRGKLSRMQPYPHEPTSGEYPPQHWRTGDYVLDQLTFTVPPLEIVSGEHELEIGMRTSRHDIYDVTRPSDTEPSHHGVEVSDRKGRFAVIGRVMVY